MIYFFLLNLVIIVIKKIVQPTGLTRPMWVGLDLCDGLDWIEFFLTHHDRLGQKISLTRPMHTPRSDDFLLRLMAQSNDAVESLEFGQRDD